MKKTLKDTVREMKSFLAELSFQHRMTRAQGTLPQSQQLENWRRSRLRKGRARKSKETHPEKEETNPLHQILTKDHPQELH